MGVWAAWWILTFNSPNLNNGSNSMEYAQVETFIIQHCGLGPVNPDKWLFVEVADLKKLDWKHFNAAGYHRSPCIW